MAVRIVPTMNQIVMVISVLIIDRVIGVSGFVKDTVEGLVKTALPLIPGSDRQ